MKCRHQAVQPNIIWHLDIHNWAKIPNNMTLLTIEADTPSDYERFQMFREGNGKKNGIPGTIWGEKNLGKRFQYLLN